MEGDASFAIKRTKTLISTHALTWRATGYGGVGNKILADFYPRPHMEGDCLTPIAATALMDFYPRPHMEGDQAQFILTYEKEYFYPRPHMEGDEFGFNSAKH